MNSISDATSQAIQDENISPTEFYKILQEMEKHCRLKEEFWKQNKVKLRKITKEPREELVEQGKKEGKEDFIWKIAGTSSIQGVIII